MQIRMSTNQKNKICYYSRSWATIRFGLSALLMSACCFYCLSFCFLLFVQIKNYIMSTNLKIKLKFSYRQH